MPRRTQEQDPFAAVAKRHGAQPARPPRSDEEDPFGAVAQRHGVDSAATPERREPISLPGVVVSRREFDPIRPLEDLIAEGEPEPATERTPRVTAGPLKVIGTNVGDVARTAARGNIPAAISLAQAPEEVRELAAPIARKERAPSKAATLTRIAAANAFSPFSDRAADLSTQDALERYAEGGGDVGKLATPAGLAASLGAVAGTVAASAVPAAQLPRGASAVRTVLTRAGEGAAQNAAAEAFGAGVVEGERGSELGRRIAVGAGLGAILGGGLSALPNASKLSTEVREFLTRTKGIEAMSDMEIKTNILDRLPEADRKIIDDDIAQMQRGPRLEDLVGARRIDDQPESIELPTPAQTARGRTARTGEGVEDLELRLRARGPESPELVPPWRGRTTTPKEPPPDAGATLAPPAETQPWSRGGRVFPHGAAVNITRMNVDEIVPDPERFQYKRGGDEATGAGAELKGLSTFDEQLAGVISVWRDPRTGIVHPVNGHNRLALAKRTGHQSVNVQVLPAKTADEARAMGALANIAEGRGTPLDAAEFFRASGLGMDDLRDRVSFKGTIAKHGLGLSRLANDLFSKVQRGDLPESHGAIIGEELPAPEMQRVAVQTLEGSNKRLNDAEVREVARQIAFAGSERITQESLFGTEGVEQPLYVELAQLATMVKRRLNQDRRLFGYVAKEGRAEGLARGGNVIDVDQSRKIADESAQLEEVFSQLYTRSGPIASALRESARRVANGENPKTLVDDIYPAIRQAVSEALGSRAGAGGEPSGIGVRGGEPPTEGADDLRVRDSTDPDQGAMLTPEDFEPGQLRAPRPFRGDVQLSPNEPPRGAGITLAPERLEVFALRLKDETIIEGRSRRDAFRRMEAAGYSRDDLADWSDFAGYVTSKGRFVPEGLEAIKIAFEAGQLRRDTHLYKSLAEGHVPIMAKYRRPPVRNVGGAAGREPMSVEGPLARRRIEGGEGATGLHIVSRAVQFYDPRADAPYTMNVAGFGRRWEIPKGLESTFGGRAGDPVIHKEGYRLSDGSFITRAEAQERFGDEADIGPEGRDPETGAALFHPEPEQPGLFGDDPLSNLARRHGIDPEQASMFAGKEGTVASRSLSQTEAAARGELDRLREELRLADPETRAAIAARIADLEKLVNRGEKITADEIATQRARADDVTDTPDQGVLLSPAKSPKGGRKQAAPPAKPATTPLQQIVAKVTALSRATTAAVKGKLYGDPDVRALRSISVGLADAVGVPLHQGRGNLKRSGARGAFWIQPEVIRVKRIGHVGTVMHESLHYLDKKLGLRAIVHAEPDADIRKQVQAELVQLGRDLYGSKHPEGGYASEGVAEFGKFYVTDPAHLQARAPNAYRVLSDILDQTPELKAALDKARADFEEFDKSPADAKIGAMIEEGVPSRFNLSPREFVRQVFDDLEPIRNAVELLGKPGNATEDAYTLARLTKGNAGRAQDIIQRGGLEFGKGNVRVTRGLPEILKDIGERDLGPFTRYWVSEQVLTKTGQGIDTGFDVNAAREIVLAGRANPKYVKAAKELWDFRSALLQYMQDAGLPVNAARIRKGNPTPTPFYRYFEPDESIGGLGVGKKMARTKAPVYQLKGSDRAILPPLESLVSDAYRMVDVAHRHHAAQVLIKHALRTEGGGKVAELLPETPKEARRIAIGRVHEQLVDAGWTPPQAQPGAPEPSQLDVLLAFYDKRRAGLSEIQDRVMPVSIDGDLRWVQINDPTLYDALQSMNVQELEGWARMLSLPTRLLRMGATQRNPDFMLVNPIRDAFQAAVYSEGPSHLPGYHISRGLFHWVRERIGDGDELFQRWAQEGGESASMVGADRRLVKEAYEKTVADLTATGGRWAWRQATHPFRAMSALFEALENATRLGEAATVREQALKRGAPEREASMRGSFAARNVSLDFFKSGEQTRKANRFVAFLTAHLNDIEKMAREFSPHHLLETPEARKRWATVVARATAYITVPSVTLYLLQKDDPVYQEVPEYWKATSWVIVDNENGPIAYTAPSGRKIRVWVIPRPHLLGYVFGYQAEKALEWLDTDDPGALRDMAKQAWTAFLPLSMVVPTLAVPLIENYANESLFNNRPIVPEAMRDLPKPEQASRSTGETARTIGQYTNQSPAQLENILRGYTGGLGMLAKDVTDVAVTKAKRSLDEAVLTPPRQQTDDPLESLPVVRRFLVPTPGGNSKSVERVIADFERADGLRKAWLAKRRVSLFAAAQYFTEHEAEIRSVMTTQEAGAPGPLRQAYSEIMRLKRGTKDIYNAASSDSTLRLDDLVRANAAQQVRTARGYRGVRP